MSKMMKLKKVKSLNKLFHLARTNDKYKQLLFIGASNLGYSGPKDNIDSAMRYLNMNVMETSEDGCDKGVVDEVNFCIDLVK